MTYYDEELAAKGREIQGKLWGNLAAGGGGGMTGAELRTRLLQVGAAVLLRHVLGP